MTYEQLMQEAEDDIEILEISFKSGLKGLYSDGIIGINQRLKTTEKKCVLAEEIGHYRTSTGNILDLSSVCNFKQEHIARNWSYEKLIPLESLIKPSFEGCCNLFELAEYLDVTEEFLKDTLQHYQNKFGLYAEVNDYCIYFSPLTVCKYNYE